MSFSLYDGMLYVFKTNLFSTKTALFMKTRQLLTAFLLSLITLVATNCTKTTIVNETPAIDVANNAAVGASAHEMLTADKPSMVFEIDYMPGFSLQPATITYVTNFLSSYTKKGNYQVIQKQIAASGKDSLSLQEIDKIERQNRTQFNTTNQVAVYILITDGTYNPTNTLGFAYRNTSITLFGKALQNFSGGFFQVSRTKLEATTLEHEFGHLLGLVNNGSPMQANHVDPAHPKHCINKSCLMYYETESGAVLGNLSSGSIPTLDANCHNDLIANGGK
jgi:hypothetical protein